MQQGPGDSDDESVSVPDDASADRQLSIHFENAVITCILKVPRQVSVGAVIIRHRNRLVVTVTRALLHIQMETGASSNDETD